MPVGVQCPISSSLGEFPSYWDWLWCPGLSPVLVSIALPFAFHTSCFPFTLICHWISIVFLLYGRRIATHSVYPSLTHFLGEFPGLGLALVPEVRYIVLCKNYTTVLNVIMKPSPNQDFASVPHMKHRTKPTVHSCYSPCYAH